MSESIREGPCGCGACPGLPWKQGGTRPATDGTSRVFHIGVLVERWTLFSDRNPAVLGCILSSFLDPSVHLLLSVAGGEGAWRLERGENLASAWLLRASASTCPSSRPGTGASTTLTPSSSSTRPTSPSSCSPPWCPTCT